MESRNKIAVIIIIVLIAWYALYLNVDNIESLGSSIVKGFETSIIAPVVGAFDDECKNKCISINAMGFDPEGKACRCWFDEYELINDEDKCKSHCDAEDADDFDIGYKDDELFAQEYCRCWFKGDKL